MSKYFDYLYDNKVFFLKIYVFFFDFFCIKTEKLFIRESNFNVILLNSLFDVNMIRITIKYDLL